LRFFKNQLLGFHAKKIVGSKRTMRIDHFKIPKRRFKLRQRNRGEVNNFISREIEREGEREREGGGERERES